MVELPALPMRPAEAPGGQDQGGGAGLSLTELDALCATMLPAAVRTAVEHIVAERDEPGWNQQQVWAGCYDQQGCWQGSANFEQVEHAHLVLAVDEVEALLVVDELDHLPLDALALVLLLLALEDVPVELLLQPLVGVVDAELRGGAVHSDGVRGRQKAAEGGRRRQTA